MSNIYDFIVIGAGISGCTFASYLNNAQPTASILLVEQGRRLGGRSTTRISRKNKFLIYDHGLPSIALSKNISKDLSRLILSLFKSKSLLDITKDILYINECGELDQLSNQKFMNKKIYRGFPYMKSVSESIINQSKNPKKIDLLHNTFIQSMKQDSNHWKLTINKQKFLKCSKLILSSSLPLHPRCLDVKNINNVPLRDAINEGEDEIVDSILEEIKKQKYIKRRNYIFHSTNSLIVKNFNYEYLQVYFSQKLREKYNLERIIFQIQVDGSMIVVLHSLYLNEPFDIEFIIKSITNIFCKHKKFTDLFSQLKLIDTMDWRASQPISNFVSEKFQWSARNNIGFCGDWLMSEPCGSVEGAMNSSIRLVKLLNNSS